MKNKISRDKEQPLYEGGMSLGLPVAIGLIWSFLVRDLEMLNVLGPLPKNFLLGGLIAGLTYWFHSFKFKFTLTLTQIYWFLGFFALICAVNSHVLIQAIACDELYHAGMASLAVRAIEKLSLKSELGQMLGFRPMPESVALISVGVLFVTIFLISGWRTVQKRVASTKGKSWFLFLGVWLVATLVGQLFRTLPVRSEVHPPLRLLPLFLSQTLFGYDDLSFRIPGVVLLALVALVVATYVLRCRGADNKIDRYIAVAAGGLTCLIPTVAHAATIVEPSIWAFGVWVFSFVLLDRYLRTDDSDAFVAAGVLIGLGSLMRQNVIVLWPIMGLILLVKRPPLRVWIGVILPSFFVVPYLLLVARGHHAATSGAGLDNVLKSFSGLEGFKLILASTTLPWLVVGMGLLHLCLYRKWWIRSPGVVLALSIMPAYVLYFSIWDLLWGLGRYQAEYIGAVIAILMAVGASHLSLRFTSIVSALAAVLAMYSVGVLRTLHYDTYYQHWTRKRITTESMYPYREALGFFHRQNTSGNFAFVGGVPTYGWYLFYLRGFSYAEMDEYNQRQGKFEAAMQLPGQLEKLPEVAKGLGVNYIVIQWGDKREQQHRTGWHNNVESLLRRASMVPSSGVTLEHRFYGDLEGAIDIYRI